MSRIYVDRISPFQSGSLTIDGFSPTVDTGSFATTGSNTFQGNQTVNGAVTQNFAAPDPGNELGFVNVSSANVNGKNYSRVFNGFANYPGFGISYQDYFTIEYYDSFSYNFGSEFSINGKQAQLASQASGSAQISSVRAQDNYDGTSQVTLTSPNKIAIVGKAELSNVLQLAPQDPLPGGGTGQLAVSGSNLYYHNGSNWAQIN